MLFDSALIFSFSFASAVLADCRREHKSRLLNRVEQSTDSASDGIQYSSNWSGAVWDETDGTFNYVTGTFTVPYPSGQSGAAASAWVGIDGDTCTNGLLQTGIDFTVTDEGATYDAWYEWYPDYAYYFSDISISAGDVIRASVTTSSTTSGTATIENLTNGQTVTQQLNSPFALCGQNAEWIVEDFEDSNGDLVPFADFGAVTFWDTQATGTGSYTADGANVLEIDQNYQVLTSAWTDGSGSLNIEYM